MNIYLHIASGVTFNIYQLRAIYSNMSIPDDADLTDLGYSKLPNVEPIQPRIITLGALQKRIGATTVFAIDTSTDPLCVALRSYLNRLSYINLDDPDLQPMLSMLVQANQPAANPLFPGSGPLTTEKVSEIISAPVLESERP